MSLLYIEKHDNAKIAPFKIAVLTVCRSCCLISSIFLTCNSYSPWSMTPWILYCHRCVHLGAAEAVTLEEMKFCAAAAELSWVYHVLFADELRRWTNCIHGVFGSMQHFFTAWCYASAVLAMGLCLCLSVCLSQVGVLLKRLNVGSHKQHHTIVQGL